MNSEWLVAKLAQNERRRDELHLLACQTGSASNATGSSDALPWCGAAMAGSDAAVTGGDAAMTGSDSVATGSDATTAAIRREMSLLEDEYLALMMQSEEFLLELRQDADFMSTLSRGETL